MRVCRERCEELGLNPKKVESIARRISKAVEEANALGLYLFAGDSCGYLVNKESIESRQGKPNELVVAELDGDMDGGAGDDLISFNN